MTDVLCDGCLPRSFVVESARRRPGLLERLARDGYGAFERYEAQTRQALRDGVRAGMLSHVRYDADDEDWFLLPGAEWPDVFTSIERLYAAPTQQRRDPCTTS